MVKQIIAGEDKPVPALNDRFLIRDMTTNTDKDTSVGGIATAIAKEIISPFYTELNNGSGSRSSTNVNSWQRPVGGFSYTNTRSVAVKVQVTGSVMFHSTDSPVVGRTALYTFSGSTLSTFSMDTYHSLAQSWVRYTLNGEFTLAAGATTELGFAIKVDDNSGRYVEIANASSDVAARLAPTLQGFSYIP